MIGTIASTAARLAPMARPLAVEVGKSVARTAVAITAVRVTWKAARSHQPSAPSTAPKPSFHVRVVEAARAVPRILRDVPHTLRAALREAIQTVRTFWLDLVVVGAVSLLWQFSPAAAGTALLLATVYATGRLVTEIHNSAKEALGLDTEEPVVEADPEVVEQTVEISLDARRIQSNPASVGRKLVREHALDANGELIPGAAELLHELETKFETALRVSGFEGSVFIKAMNGFRSEKERLLGDAA